MEAYSQDLRDRVLRALERGERPTAIAARFEVRRVSGAVSQLEVIGSPGWSGWSRHCGRG
jgi:hypothetical protein